MTALQNCLAGYSILEEKGLKAKEVGIPPQKSARLQSSQAVP